MFRRSRDHGRRRPYTAAVLLCLAGSTAMAGGPPTADSLLPPEALARQAHAFAQDRAIQESDVVWGFAVAGKLHLESPAGRELLSENVVVDLGPYDASRPPALPPVRTVVLRQIPDLWQAAVLGAVRPESVRVTAQVEAPDGSRGRLQAGDGARSYIRAVVQPLSPRVVLDDGTVAVVRGGAVLELHLEGATVPGPYSGTITVTLDGL